MNDSVLWRWDELCAALDLPPADGPPVSGISIDSRSVTDGDLFVALSGDPGPRFHSSGGGGRDGHEFLAQAEQSGAAGALVRNGTEISMPCLPVADTLDGLWALGVAARQRMDGQVVAITGSAGKTTARQWLEEILSAQSASTHASTGSFNNHWGVPLSLARMPRDAAFGVFEVGTNHPGEIAPLSSMVSPHVSILLNVLPAHIGNFPGMDALRQEKLSIEAGLRERGTLIVPQELDRSGSLTRNVLTFGQSRNADVFGKATYRAGGTDVTVRIGGLSWSYRLNLPGEHRFLTSLAVFGALFAMDADLDQALSAFETLTVPAGRGNVVAADGMSIIDDSYNANPVSMRFALESLAREQGFRLAILGEMLELGESSRAMHEDIEPICDAVDAVVTVGSGFEVWGNALGDRHWAHFSTAAEIDLGAFAERILAQKGKDMDGTVLVKGSNKVFWVNGFVDRLAAALSATVSGA